MVLNALDAAARGAEILTRTRFERAERDGDGWRLRLRGERRGRRGRGRGRSSTPPGPWVERGDPRRASAATSAARVRLVKGSHIVTRKLFEHDRAYIFQNADGRVIFAIPYEGDFTLIGTTDVEHEGAPGEAVCTPEERDYLLGAVGGYFARAGRRRGHRLELFRGAAALRRRRDLGDGGDARLRVRAATSDGGAPAVDVFGGKITTYRRLAEAALAKLAPFFPGMRGAWTAGVPLPGGDFPVGRRRRRWPRSCASAFPFLDAAWAGRLVRGYGTEAAAMLDGARRRRRTSASGSAGT